MDNSSLRIFKGWWNIWVPDPKMQAQLMRTYMMQVQAIQRFWLGR